MQKNNPFKQNTVQYEHSKRKLQEKYLCINIPVFVKTVLNGEEHAMTSFS